MKSKLQRIHTPWRRLIITVLVNFLLWATRLRRRRAHWVGRRRRRLERPLIVLLFLCAILFLEPREYAIWSAIWGGITSIAFIVFQAYYIKSNLK